MNSSVRGSSTVANLSSGTRLVEQPRLIRYDIFVISPTPPELRCRRPPAGPCALYWMYELRLWLRNADPRQALVPLPAALCVAGPSSARSCVRLRLRRTVALYPEPALQQGSVHSGTQPFDKARRASAQIVRMRLQTANAFGYAYPPRDRSYKGLPDSLFDRTQRTRAQARKWPLYVRWIYTCESARTPCRRRTRPCT